MGNDASSSQHPVSITDDGSSRYEARSADGEVVGSADYLVRGDSTVFPHTVVDPAHRGGGVASALATRALDDARSRGRTVVPACSFFEVFISRHPEYQDLVAAG